MSQIPLYRPQDCLDLAGRFADFPLRAGDPISTPPQSYTSASGSVASSS